MGEMTPETGNGADEARRKTKPEWKGTADRVWRARRMRPGADAMTTEVAPGERREEMCPICSGMGKIPKEEEKHRVALIRAGKGRGLEDSFFFWQLFVYQ